MSAHLLPESDAELDQALRQWKVSAALPPRFQEQVWQRLERAQPQAQPGLWTALSRLVDVVLPRPRFALAFLAVLMAAGGAAGSWTAQVRSSRVQVELGQRYVQSIDPSRSETLHP